MLHVATVHWGTSFFKDIQYNFLKKNISNLKIWAFCDKIPDSEKSTEQDLLKYHFCRESGEWNHRIKLNMLADLIYKEAQSEDTILFLDGDAWPIVPVEKLIEETLKKYPVGAVLRSENGEKHAHPCFMFTKIRFWKENNLNWKGGELNGKKCDVGYNTRVLESKKLDWQKLRRTKGLTDHKVFFSIYGDIVYHHGAGFRNPVSGYCKGKGINMTKEENLSMLEKFIENYGK